VPSPCHRPSPRNLVISLLAGCLLTAGLPATARTLAQLEHVTWTRRDGVPEDIRAMAQTTDGWLWIGTSNGLWRFDGLRFSKAESAGATRFPDKDVYVLRADQAGGLWIGWMFGGVTHYHAGKVRNWTTADGLPPGAIWSFATDGKGIWAAGIAGLAHFDGTRWQRMGPAQGYTAPAAAAVFVHADGTVAAFSDRGLFLRRPGAARFDAPIAGPATRQEPQQRGNGRVWFLEQRGIRALDSLAGYAGTGRWLYRSQDPVSGSMLADSRGALWFDTVEGLQRHPDPLRADVRPDRSLAPGTEPFTVAQGLSGPIVHCMAEDGQGNVWVATNRGLDRFRAASLVSAPLPTVDRIRLQPGSGAGVVASDGNGSWRLHADGSARSVPTSIGALAVATAADGTLWHATASALRHLSADGATLLGQVPYPVDVAPANNVRSIALEREGSVWIVVSGRGVLRYAGGRWQRNAALPEGGHKTPIAVMADSRDRVWIGYEDNQVAIVDGATVTMAGAAQGLVAGRVGLLVEYAGSIWVGGSDGLARWDDRRFVPVRADPPAALTGLVGAAGSPEGLWLNGGAGLVLLPAAALNSGSTVPARVFDSAHGLDGQAATLSNNAIVRAADGRIWLSTGGGAFWLDPAALRPEPVPAAPTMLRVAADGRDYDPTLAIHLPPNPARIAFRFATPATAMAQHIRYRYQLQGYDRTWQQAGRETEVTYTGLPPGDYRFMTQAINGMGVAGPVSAALPVQVPPTAVQTIWFKLACGMLALLALGAFYRYRLRLQARRLLAIEQTRHAERDRIARELHDTLLQSVQGLVLRFQAAVERLPKADPLRVSLTTTLERADAVMAEARDRVQGLRRQAPITAALPQMLAAALSQACEEADAPECDFAHTGTPRPLTPEMDHACLSIAIEAARNACRHAGARHITVRLHYEADTLQLTVADDGRGIDEGTLRTGRAGHWGIAGMRERAVEVGGTLRIRSAAGQGTEVVLLLPYPD
jgi:signal transduction histidine kinase/ligand-binding sensor domain-containing protein